MDQGSYVWTYSKGRKDSRFLLRGLRRIVPIKLLSFHKWSVAAGRRQRRRHNLDLKYTRRRRSVS